MHFPINNLNDLMCFTWFFLIQGVNIIYDIWFFLCLFIIFFLYCWLNFRTCLLFLNDFIVFSEGRMLRGFLLFILLLLRGIIIIIYDRVVNHAIQVLSQTRRVHVGWTIVFDLSRFCFTLRLNKLGLVILSRLRFRTYRTFQVRVLVSGNIFQSSVNETRMPPRSPFLPVKTLRKL